MKTKFIILGIAVILVIVLAFIAGYLISYMLNADQCIDEIGKDTEDILAMGKCKLEPETGPCKALFTRYYFDQQEGICKEFIWGGCQGVVPFETLNECKSICE